MTLLPIESEAHAQANAEQVRLLREALAQRWEKSQKPGDRTPSPQAEPPTSPHPWRRP